MNREFEDNSIPETEQPAPETEVTAEPSAELAAPSEAPLNAPEAPEKGGRGLHSAYDMKKIDEQVEALNLNTKKKKRNWWIKTTLILVLIAGSVALMFGITSLLSDDSVSFSDMISNVKWSWFAILIAVILLSMTAESMKYSYLLKISTGKWRIRNSVKTMFLGKYYDGITPLGTGGQPFQIYYLHKKDIPAGVATSVPLVRYIVGTIVFCIVAIALLIVAPFIVPASATSTTVLIVAWVAMAVNFAIPVIIVVASLFPKAGNKLVAGIVKLFTKLHIVKRKHTTMKKYVREMDEYRFSLRTLIKHFGKLLPLVGICLIETITYVAIPFCAVTAIANVTPTWDHFLQIACLCIISYYTASLVPTPGNSGANEGATAFIFVSVLSGVIKPYVGWVVLVWRFFTFYIYILSGIGINIFEIIRSAYRNKKAQRLQQK